MSEFIPSGYISVREAENRLGRDLFPSEWTEDEYRARSGLISEKEWLAIKDLPPARGGDAGSLWVGRPVARPTPATSQEREDPLSPPYQQEYQARVRYEAVRDRLRALLEAGEYQAAILDPVTGKLHRAPRDYWRRSDADQVLRKQEAPLPYSRNTGRLLIEEFHLLSQPRRSLSRPQTEKIIAALREKTATESLTRAQQQEFVTTEFPQYQITHRQFLQIFKQVPSPTGRPKKSNRI